MRLFLYYALHSFKNQVKKIFKTWVAVFILVCVLVGAGIGFGAAKLSDLKDEQDAQQTEETVEEAPGEEEDGPTMTETLGIDKMQLIELIVGAVLVAVFVMEAVNADKNGSKIFLPADVDLLFAAPMKPQSVLLFRLMTQLGVAIAGSLYMLFQIPNLTLNMGLSLWGALGMIFTWCAAIFTGKMVQVLLYLLCAQHPVLKDNLRRIVIGVLALIALAFGIRWKMSGMAVLPAAAAFFNAPVSRYIPLWGWLKGICMFSAEGNTTGAVLCIAATMAGGALLVFIAQKLNVDFYEDAMAKSEETAALMERMQAERPSRVMIKRKKDRSEKLRRDGFRYGCGANVFFCKTMYNRFRFAHFGFLTKTTETYILAAVLAAVLCRTVLDWQSILPLALLLSVFAFFRALGNPLAEDTEIDYFALVPEPSGAKLWYSLLGGTACCAMDVLPAMVIGALILRTNLLEALAWTVLAVSVDFYATNVGTFIGLSVPTSAGKTIKQIVQIMFVYFGLLPDVAIMAVGLVMGYGILAAVIAAAVNVALGMLFFGLSPLFLPPQGGR